MTKDEARALLTTLASADHPAWRTASRVVQHRAGGGSDAWDLFAEGEVYVTKFANNPQEPPVPHPRKVVSSDLIVGRMGHLFEPPVAPEVTVVGVPMSVVESQPIKMGGSLATDGPAFGALVIPHHVETKAGATLTLVPPWRIAQLLAFQALAQGTDLAALVSEDGVSVVSVDHGGYFGGGSWGLHLGAGAESPTITPFGGFDESKLRDPAVWSVALTQLSAITDELLAEAFTGIPESWGCDITLLAPLLAVTSRRRDRLPEVIDAYQQS